MTDLVAAAQIIQAFCEKRNWQFCFIGGLALQFWGEQRLTKDVDLTLITGFGGEEKFIDELTANFPARLPDAKEFALKNRVLLLQTESGIGIDVSLGALPFEQSVVARGDYREFLLGVSLKICSAEDLIVLKAFADRPKDWNDISTILIKQKTLDWRYVAAQLPPLVEAKETPEILDKLETLRRRIAK